MVMEAVPELVFGLGVKMAVRVSPVPEMAESVPPVMEISWSVNVLPGSSETVKVMVADSPAFKVLTSLVMQTVGGRVSKERLAMVPAVPLLSAASV